ncbi:protein Wnt-2 isoform X2 [Zeugodacus cucurbitae]|nr:protein Wnt-2 isoform X2 [Zeugodacus cucurbitae]
MGSHECQHQFRGHRWNCSQVWQEGVFAHVMFVGSPEAAFTYAIASAGAAHSVTAACARGNISLCGCDMRHKPTSMRHADAANLDASGSQMGTQSWKWGGCSADVDFGMKFTRKFLDAREIEGDARTLMNLHNNRVGRRLVKNLLKTECKCHGMSGSCAMKACWKSLPSFRQIGEVLMRKYKKAKRVHAVRGKNGLKLVLSNRKHRFGDPKYMGPELSKKDRDPKRMELVYLQESPDYCERNVKLGILGTTGRVCNRTLTGPQSCDLLCCERGYNTRQVRRRAKCRCQFVWCCDVVCDVCEENYEEFTCK